MAEQTTQDPGEPPVDREDEDMRRLRAACAVLMEHFESCQIFVTRDEGDEMGTCAAKFGAGNWFARYGQVSRWVDENRTGE